jgi:hypothetical protein
MTNTKLIVFFKRKDYSKYRYIYTKSAQAWSQDLYILKYTPKQNHKLKYIYQRILILYGIGNDQGKQYYILKLKEIIKGVPNP